MHVVLAENIYASPNLMLISRRIQKRFNTVLFIQSLFALLPTVQGITSTQFPRSKYFLIACVHLITTLSATLSTYKND